FRDQERPGILINEFKAGQTDCGCGTDFHSGPDFSAEPGSPAPAVDDGVVVRVEQDERAVVETPTAGRCGRYVVIKHSLPNGRTAYSRYAQLGRLVGQDGKPITVGQKVKTRDTVGEVGSRALLHFEIRPADEATMDRSAEWAQRYGADASMEWSKYV